MHELRRRQVLEQRRRVHRLRGESLLRQWKQLMHELRCRPVLEQREQLVLKLRSGSIFQQWQCLLKLRSG